jgi:hypothetical protein
VNLERRRTAPPLRASDEAEGACLNHNACEREDQATSLVIEFIRRPKTFVGAKSDATALLR